jgi:hypothetical protein
MMRPGAQPGKRLRFRVDGDYLEVNSCRFPTSEVRNKPLRSSYNSICAANSQFGVNENGFTFIFKVTSTSSCSTVCRPRWCAFNGLHPSHPRRKRSELAGPPSCPGGHPLDSAAIRHEKREASQGFCTRILGGMLTLTVISVWSTFATYSGCHRHFGCELKCFQALQCLR